MASETERRLAEIEGRALAASEGPWKSYIEGRDHQAGDSFIQTTGKPDLYIINSYGADDYDLNEADANQDFIAGSREDIPWLVGRVHHLMQALRDIDSVIGPPGFDCPEHDCAGCKYEMEQAARLATEALR